MTEGFRLDTTKPTEDFNRHLSIDGNNRIIFSGPFGSGKTSFLKEYFEVKEKYEVFHLFPINYSVASNGDIFELIKFDLLFELLGRDVDLEKEDFSKQMTLQMFLLNNQFDVAKTFYESVKPVFEGVSKIGKDVTEIFNPISKLYEKWKKYHADIQLDEKKGVIDYLESFTKESGSVHEEDIFTQIIRNLLAQIKEKGKKTILIIDDLDRIDPEHIFRLLNIFAAHFDSPSYKCEENKFGFNQIMLVCDLNNIRNIFFNKYGQNVDFTGYIDKFYSKDVFVFDNLRVLEDTIDNVLRSMSYCQISTNFLRGANDHVKKVISGFIYNQVLNLRDLEKVWQSDYIFNSKSISPKYGGTQNSWQFSELILVDFLKIFFGEIGNLKTALLKSKNVNLKSDNIFGNNARCLHILTLFTQNTHKFVVGKYVFEDKISKREYQYELQSYPSPGMFGRQFFLEHLEHPHQDAENLNFFELLLGVLEMAQTENYIN